MRCFTSARMGVPHVSAGRASRVLASALFACGRLLRATFVACGWLLTAWALMFGWLLRLSMLLLGSVFTALVRVLDGLSRLRRKISH